MKKVRGEGIYIPFLIHYISIIQRRYRMTFIQSIANQIPTGLDRYDQIFEAKRLILKTDSSILATCRETLEEIEEIIFQRDSKIGDTE